MPLKTNKFYTLWVAYLAAGAVLAFFLSAGDSLAASSNEATLDKAVLAKGKKTYETTCIACHGKNGRGAIPGMPDFTSKKGPLIKTDAELGKSVWEGLKSPGSPLAMPPKGGNPGLSEEDVKDVIVYIRATFGTKQK